MVGSGAVKITPAHDPNDFACAKRHRLPVNDILDDSGSINAAGAGSENATGLLGVDRFAARAILVHRLSELGLYRGKTSHPMRLARCSRSGDVIEPRIKSQWFVHCGDMAKAAAGMASSSNANGSSSRSRKGGSAPDAKLPRAVDPLQFRPHGQAREWDRWLQNVQVHGK
eukprot:SAG31_NODE_276_length_18650_cov_5.821842_22_plen_170_part_00